ncbi:MAG: hydrogenase maturation nickel metallochaperone HypA [Candidatus Omnitrophica bacterium]|nr:hydrogenase maturation nickel metallochaperone HypA [Candidatus Omnitrophota bacterium]
MHEYSLMEQVIAEITSQLPGKNIKPEDKIEQVILRVGALDVHSDGSTEQAFKMLTKDTPLEGAELELILVAPTLTCEECGYKGEVPDGGADGHDPIPCAECPSCGMLCEVEGGRGVDSIELIQRQS